MNQLNEPLELMDPCESIEEIAITEPSPELIHSITVPSISIEHATPPPSSPIKDESPRIEHNLLNK